MSSTERKIATMLFADLVGSTALASSDDPEQTRILLDRFYDAMTEEISATGGTVEKFAGDAVMAVFGVPLAHEDHAERALHTALAMRARMQRILGGRLQLRIGVNSGEVVVGEPRAGSSFVSGDAVNVAARLEQGAAPGEILVGERTAALVGAAFDLSAPTTIEAKGRRAGSGPGGSTGRSRPCVRGGPSAGRSSGGTATSTRSTRPWTASSAMAGRPSSSWSASPGSARAVSSMSSPGGPIAGRRRRSSGPAAVSRTATA